MTRYKYELTVTRLIKAPRNIVWNAWIDPKQLEKWWCPKPWRTEIVGFRPEPGGAFDFVLHGPDGERNAVPGAFLEIDDNTRIIFTTALLEGYQPATPWLAFTAIITMTDEDGGTRYTARVMHKDAEDNKRHADMGFEEGWGTCLRQLAELVE